MLDSSTVVTRKLYYDDANIREFQANIISARDNDIVLDATAFFPEEGGQSADKGILAGHEVVDVQIRDGFIHHYLGQAAAGEMVTAEFREGMSVCGKIDWNHRFSNMQQHSGEHLFSGLIHRKYGFNNVGFHLSDREVTMDFDGVIPAGDLSEIEKELNRIICLNIPSEIVFLNGKAAEKADYRSKIDLKENVRVVIFSEFDACACCAPHVGRTGEIGCLKIVGVMNYKGGMRVSMLCGGRAMELFRHDRDILTGTANFLTTNTDEVYNSVCRIKAENTELKARLKQSQLRVMEIKAESFPTGDVNALMFVEPDTDQAAMREIVNTLMEKRGGYCGVFAGNDREGYRFIIGKKDGDARAASAVLRERCGARGGGKPAMVQGSVNASERKLRRAFEELS